MPVQKENARFSTRTELMICRFLYCCRIYDYDFAEYDSAEYLPESGGSRHLRLFRQDSLRPALPRRRKAGAQGLRRRVGAAAEPAAGNRYHQ